MTRPAMVIVRSDVLPRDHGQWRLSQLQQEYLAASSVERRSAIWQAELDLRRELALGAEGQGRRLARFGPNQRRRWVIANRLRAKRHSDELTDSRVRSALGIVKEMHYPVLIEAKRAQLKLHRLLKEMT